MSGITKTEQIRRVLQAIDNLTAAIEAVRADPDGPVDVALAEYVTALADMKRRHGRLKGRL